MKRYICKYSIFKCNICFEDSYLGEFQKFKKDFDFYYEMEENKGDEPCDANIFIIADAYSGTIVDNEVCIHSSHSKNLKYLLDGTNYTQQNAAVFAYMKKTDENIYYYIKNTNTKVYVDLKKSSVYLSGNNIYNMLVYIYESLLVDYIESKGGIICHAASCQFNNEGYIITGKSGGGKTTLLFEIINKGGIFHANDRVALLEQDNKVLAYSIPIPVNVPIKMMRSLDGWQSIDLVKQARDDTKIRFLVPELNQLFGCNMIDFTTINKVISVNYSNSSPQCQRINTESFIDYVEVLTPYDENHPKWLPIFEIPLQGDIDETIKRIAMNVPLYRISGNDTYNTMLLGSN